MQIDVVVVVRVVAARLPAFGPKSLFWRCFARALKRDFGQRKLAPVQIGPTVSPARQSPTEQTLPAAKQSERASERSLRADCWAQLAAETAELQVAGQCQEAFGFDCANRPLLDAFVSGPASAVLQLATSDQQLAVRSLARLAKVVDIKINVNQWQLNANSINIELPAGRAADRPTRRLAGWCTSLL